MEQLSASEVKHVRAIREHLVAVRYHDLCGGSSALRRIIRTANPALLDRIWNRASNFSDTQRALLSLLFFGLRMPKRSAEKSLGQGVLESLTELGLVREYAHWFHAPDYCIIPAGEKLLVAPRLFSLHGQPSCRLYLGYDSFLLAKIVRRLAGVQVAFEIGSGTGIASLLGGKGKTIASDVDERAVRISNVNFALNNAEGLCKAVVGDMFKCLPPGRVDLIFSNPPYVPAPRQFPLPIYSWGGDDGLDFVRRIIKEFPEVASPSSRCLVVLSSYGNSEYTALDILLQQSALPHKVDLHYWAKHDIQQEDYEALAAGAMLVKEEEVSPLEFEEHYKHRHFVYRFDCVLLIDVKGPPSINVTHRYKGVRTMSLTPLARR